MDVDHRLTAGDEESEIQYNALSVSYLAACDLSSLYSLNIFFCCFCTIISREAQKLLTVDRVRRLMQLDTFTESETAE